MHLTCYHNFLESGPLQIFVYSQSHDKMAKLMTSDLKAQASAFSATMLSMLLEHSPGKQLCSIRADACCACVPSVRACGVKSEKVQVCSAPIWRERHALCKLQAVPEVLHWHSDLPPASPKTSCPEILAKPQAATKSMNEMNYACHRRRNRLCKMRVQ